MITKKNLFTKICDFDNIQDAYRKASSCKHTFHEFLLFEQNRFSNLVEILDDVSNGTYKVGQYSYFVVYEPKKREIMKLPVRDRVVQHMWNNIVVPIIEPKFYGHSYACREGYGLHSCSETLHNWLYTECVIHGKKMWAIKGDLKSYFKTINHNILKSQILRFIGDQKTINLTFEFIDSNGNLPDGIGIPVGNLSSQIFANIYGNILDEFVKYNLKIKYYIRYMDDFIILLDDYHALESMLKEINQFVNEAMLMRLNPNTTIVYAGNGIDFVGFRHFPEYTIPRKTSYKRFERFMDLYYNGFVSEEDFIRSYPSRIGHLCHCNSYNFLKRIDKELDEFYLEKAINEPYPSWYQEYPPMP